MRRPARGRPAGLANLCAELRHSVPMSSGGKDSRLAIFTHVSLGGQDTRKEGRLQLAGSC